MHIEQLLSVREFYVESVVPHDEWNARFVVFVTLSLGLNLEADDRDGRRYCPYGVLEFLVVGNGNDPGVQHSRW